VTVIDSDADCITLINTFVVRPENQDELIDVLEEATEQVMRFRPGFVSANIHKSLDGKRVVNYAQWRSQADFEAMLADPAAREHMARASGLADRVEPALYHVASVHERRPAGSFQYGPDIFVSL
jgi:quinol monooxygenase YgiN